MTVTALHCALPGLLHKWGFLLYDLKMKSWIKIEWHGLAGGGLSLRCFPETQLGGGGGVIWNSPLFARPSRHAPAYSLFLGTGYFYFSANHTWNPFTVSDSEIPVLDSDQTHVLMTEQRQLSSKREQREFDLTSQLCNMQPSVSGQHWSLLSRV